MDPDARTLLRVQVDDDQQADSLFVQLMGDDPGKRRHFIETHSHLATLDV